MIKTSQASRPVAANTVRWEVIELLKRPNFIILFIITRGLSSSRVPEGESRRASVFELRRWRPEAPLAPSIPHLSASPGAGLVWWYLGRFWSGSSSQRSVINSKEYPPVLRVREASGIRITLRFTELNSSIFLDCLWLPVNPGSYLPPQSLKLIPGFLPFSATLLIHLSDGDCISFSSKTSVCFEPIGRLYGLSTLAWGIPQIPATIAEHEYNSHSPFHEHMIIVRSNWLHCNLFTNACNIFSSYLPFLTPFCPSFAFTDFAHFPPK